MRTPRAVRLLLVAFVTVAVLVFAAGAMSAPRSGSWVTLPGATYPWVQPGSVSAGAAYVAVQPPAWIPTGPVVVVKTAAMLPGGTYPWVQPTAELPIG
jgi:hypothetical protein